MNSGSKSSLVSKAALLLSGTALAQAIPILAAPALARVYAPDAFGEFGLYSSLLAITMVAACLRYEHAILIERDEGQAKALAAVLCVLALVLAGVMTLATILLPMDFLPSTASDRINLALPLGAGLLFGGLGQVVTMMCLRREQFKAVAAARVLQSTLSTGLSLGLGLAAVNAAGQILIWSAVAGQATLLLALALVLGRAPRDLWQRRYLQAARKLLASYRRFPLFTVPADLMSAISANLPVFYVTANHGPALAGAYVLAHRVLGAPLAILGSALMDAYKQSAAALHHRGARFRTLSLKTSGYLIALLIPAGACAYLLAPAAVRWIFGPEWTESANMIQILLPALLLRLAATPVSYNFYLKGRQFEDMLAQTCGLISAVVVFQFSAHHGLTALNSLKLYSAILCAFYTYYLVRSNWLA